MTEVISYDAADTQLKAEMERTMETVTRKPFGFWEVTSGYGRSPCDKFFLLVEKAFAGQVNQCRLQDNAMADVLSWYRSESLKKSEDTRWLDKRSLGLQSEMAASVKEIEKIIVDSTELSREFALYLGSSKELLRRYNEDYIPNEQKAIKKMGYPAALEKERKEELTGFVKSLTVAFSIFEKKYMLLKTGVPLQAQEMIDTIKGHIEKIEDARKTLASTTPPVQPKKKPDGKFTP